MNWDKEFAELSRRHVRLAELQPPGRLDEHDRRDLATLLRERERLQIEMGPFYRLHVQFYQRALLGDL